VTIYKSTTEIRRLL